MNYVHPPNKPIFDELAWAIVRQIPHGKVSTYGKIAKLIPQPEGVSTEEYQTSAARWVGLSMAASPEDVPWHRVINSQGKISHNAELGKQKKLLESEGVVFSVDKVNLNEYQWAGPGEPACPEQGRLF